MGMRMTLVAVDRERLPEIRSNVDTLQTLLLDPPVGSALDIDKAWHGIHFLLTGDPWLTDSPLGAVILGGDETDLDLGYGPVRILTSAQVADISFKLKQLSIDAVRARYNPKEMSRVSIYPEVWEREGPDGLKWLLASYADLQAFYERASDDGKAVILAIV